MRIKILAVILAAVTGLAVLAFFYEPTYRPISLKQPDLTETQAPSGEVSIVKGAEQTAGQAKTEAAADSWRDPFNIPGKGGRPATAKMPAGLSALAAPVFVPEKLPQLQGIITGGLEFQAFINDEIVAVGDTVAGYKVQSIDENSVILAKEGKVTVLRLE